MYAHGTRPLAPGWLEYFAITVLGVVLVLVGRWVFGRVEHQLRQTGSLGQY